MKKPARTKDVLLREETYRKGALMIRAGKLPTLYHTNNFRVISCEIQKAGAVQRGEQRLEYQILKVFLEERPHGHQNTSESVDKRESGGTGIEACSGDGVPSTGTD